jgi:uncharacterized protein
LTTSTGLLSWYRGKIPEGHESPLHLLIVQGTPFCNINCSYCYLPDRRNRSRFNLDLLPQLLRNLSSSGLLRGDITWLWHAGEPLVLPAAYYQKAFSTIDNLTPTSCSFRHSFQTNGILIDQAFCDLIRPYAVHVGVSIDGPAFIHDTHRRTRRGAGTHSSVMKGIDLLKQNGINFSVIAVLSRLSLDHSRDIFDFFSQLEPELIAFNIEEIEGINISSSLEAHDSYDRYKKFMREFLQLATRDGRQLRVREFDRLRSSICHGSETFSSLTNPLSIITIDSEGNYSTFSPELVGDSRFHFGHVGRDPFNQLFEGERFLAVWEEIQGGGRLCEAECQYYRVCGGGSPSNKLHENGTFRSTETMFCRLTRMVLTDLLLETLERELGIVKPSEEEEQPYGAQESN